MRPNVSSEDSRNKQHPPQGAAAPATDFSLLSSWKSWVEFHTQQGRLPRLSDSWAMCFQDVCEDPDGSLNPGMHGERKTGKADRQKPSQRRIRVERPGELEREGWGDVGLISCGVLLLSLVLNLAIL